MNINDTRHILKELTWKDLIFGQVYVSSRMSKYMIFTQDYKTVCLDSGEVYDEDEHKGDMFISVDATLQVN
jgi:hypothetical protein